MAATLPSVTSPHHRTPIKSQQQNVEHVVLGSLRMHPQYASFYPEELIGGRKAPLLYVCQWCFRYTNELMKYAAHCVSWECIRVVGGGLMRTGVEYVRDEGRWG